MKSLLLPLAAALTLASCGPNSYTRGFVEASAALVRPPANAEGPWRGTWKSDVNGHTGPLWCIVRPNPKRPGEYDFRYRAGWGAVQFGDYTHTTPVRHGDNGSIALSGEMILPGGFGKYQVEGKLTRETFTATYRSAADRGAMTLQRPAP